MRADGTRARFRADVSEGVETEFHHVSSWRFVFALQVAIRLSRRQRGGW
jgi:hypothetical protein